MDQYQLCWLVGNYQRRQPLVHYKKCRHYCLLQNLQRPIESNQDYLFRRFFDKQMDRRAIENSAHMQSSGPW